MLTRLICFALLLPALPVGCGAGEVNVSAEGLDEAPPPDSVAMDSAPDAEEPAEEEADDEAPAGPPVDLAGGHVDGPLQNRRNLFFGLRDADRAAYLRDGRTLRAYQLMRPRIHKVGDAALDHGLWWFGDDNLLRKHTLWGRDLTAADCASAALKMTEDYGPPAQDTGDEKTWVGDAVIARWSDKTSSSSSPRCEVEWMDLTWFRK